LSGRAAWPSSPPPPSCCPSGPPAHRGDLRLDAPPSARVRRSVLSRAYSSCRCADLESAAHSRRTCPCACRCRGPETVVDTDPSLPFPSGRRCAWRARSKARSTCSHAPATTPRLAERDHRALDHCLQARAAHLVHGDARRCVGQTGVSAAGRGGPERRRPGAPAMRPSHLFRLTPARSSAALMTTAPSVGAGSKEALECADGRPGGAPTITTS